MRHRTIDVDLVEPFVQLRVQPLAKRFQALGFYWAIRAGYDNITGRQNPVAVNNDIDSPQFRTFSGFDGRAFTTRIRFLGRK